MLAKDPYCWNYNQIQTTNSNTINRAMPTSTIKQNTKISLSMRYN